MKRSGVFASLVVFLVVFVAATQGAEAAGYPVAREVAVSFRVTGLTVGRAYSFTFRLFDVPAGGSAVFTEQRSYKVPATLVVTHVFGSVDKAGNPLPKDRFLQQLWAEARTPARVFSRVKLSAAAYALGCQDTVTLQGFVPTDFAPASNTDAATLGGRPAAHFLDASNLNAGTLDDARLSANVDLLDKDQAISGTKTFGVPIVSAVAEGTAPLQVTSTTGVANLNADLIDDLHAADFQRKYARTAIVASSGGDYGDPWAAMAGLASWCPSRAAANPCLLKIMPGSYIQDAPLVMAEFVDIEGSGENVTLVAGRVAAGMPPTTGLVRGASNAELRSLTLSASGLGSYDVVGIYNSGASPTISHVTIKAQNGNNVFGIYSATGSAPLVRDVMISIGAQFPAVSGTGVENRASTPTVSRVSVTCQNASPCVGVRNVQSNAVISDLTVKATGTWDAAGLWNESCAALNVRNVRVEAAADVATGIELTASGGTLTGIVAEAHGQSFAAGIATHGGATPLIVGAVARGFAPTGSGSGAYAYGVYNGGSSVVTLTDVTASGEGLDRSYGLIFESAAGGALTNVSATGTCAGGECHGLGLQYSGCAPGDTCSTVVAERCTFASLVKAGAPARSVTIEDGYELKMGASGLGGGIARLGGTLSCLYNYNVPAMTAVTCP